MTKLIAKSVLDAIRSTQALPKSYPSCSHTHAILISMAQGSLEGQRWVLIELAAVFK